MKVTHTYEPSRSESDDLIYLNVCESLRLSLESPLRLCCGREGRLDRKGTEFAWDRPEEEPELRGPDPVSSSSSSSMTPPTPSSEEEDGVDVDMAEEPEDAVSVTSMGEEDTTSILEEDIYGGGKSVTKKENQGIFRARGLLSKYIKDCIWHFSRPAVGS